MPPSSPLDVLVLAAHPDDAELACGGTLAKLTAEGHRVGIADLTRGELGTRGTPAIRAQEAADAAGILGLSLRENLGLRDGFFRHDEAHLLAVIRSVRRHRPRIVLTNAPEDRHPDHGRAATLVREAAWLAGLRNIETEDEGQPQTAHRPERLFHFIQDRYLHPSFVVDVTAHIDTKWAAIRAYKSQFHDPNSSEPETYISSPAFLDFLQARAQAMGHLIGTPHGEGFISSTPVKVPGLMDLL